MRYFLLFAAALVCGSAPVQAELRVVTTTPDVASMVEAVGGEHVTVRSLQDGDRNPHFLQAKPSYIAAARRADLWIRIGMELEIGYEPVILRQCRNARIQPGTRGFLDLSKSVQKLEVPRGPIDRSMGDVHPAGNPHYWLDPRNGRRMVLVITERLKELAPANAEDFDRNAAAFLKRLDEAMFGQAAVGRLGGEALWEALDEGALDEHLKEADLAPDGWYGQLNPHRGAEVLEHHKSWVYLLNRFGLKSAGQLEPKPGVPPSSSHLAQVIRTARRGKVRAILVEPYYSTKAAELVASRTGAAVVQVANMTTEKTRDYVGMMDQVVSRLVEALDDR